jgi:creatinine amidohydrolase
LGNDERRIEMATRGPWLHERRWPEVREYLEREDVVLLPVGSTEQHGRHLPLMTDAAEAIAVAVEAGERGDVLVAPPLWLGWTPHHMSYPGTVTLRAETLTAVIEDVCTSLAYHGFKRILIVNGHRVANLPPIEIAVVRVRNRTGAYVLVYDLALSARVEIAAITSGVPGAVGHACEDETSQMLHSHGNLVAMEEAVAAVHPPTGRFHLSGFASPDPSLPNLDMAWSPRTVEEFGRATAPTGVTGDPTAATAEKGRRIFEAEVGNLLDLVEQSRKEPVELKQVSVPM